MRMRMPEDYPADAQKRVTRSQIAEELSHAIDGYTAMETDAVISILKTAMHGRRPGSAVELRRVANKLIDKIDELRELAQKCAR